MKAYTGAFMHAPGASNACTVDQVAQKVLYKESWKNGGQQEPKADEP